MALLEKTKEIKDYTEKNKSESQPSDKIKQTDKNKEQINNEKMSQLKKQYTNRR